MKITVVTFSRRRIGGIEQHLELLLPELERRNHTVQFVYMNDRPANRKPISPLSTAAPVDVEQLVRAAQQVLGGEVYVYQSKINWKLPFSGTAWDWHQDFTFWYYEDAMPAPRATNVVVYLDDVTQFNGPLYLVPGSHQDGIADYAALAGQPAGYELAPSWISNLTAKIKYSVEHDCLSRAIEKYGLISPTAPAGSILLFDSNIIHASPPNITPLNRTTAMFTYNRVDNAPPESKRRRPEFLSSADSRPIAADSPLGDGSSF